MMAPTPPPTRSRRAATTAPRSLLIRLLLLVGLTLTLLVDATTASAAAAPAPAANGAGASASFSVSSGSWSKSSSSSPKHGCASIAGCKSCSKSGCTACKTGADPVAGKCLCGAGSGEYGTANTEPVVLANGRRRRKLTQAAVKASSLSSSSSASTATKSAHGGGKKGSRGGASSSFACAQCSDGAYAATAQPVNRARCKLCPDGTTSSEDKTTCLVEPGFVYNPVTGTIQECAANKWCPGGDWRDQGRTSNRCPSGSTSPVQSDEFGDCSVPAGSFYDAETGKVLKCSVGRWCEGGSAASTGQTVNPCPQGSTTAAPGSSTEAQCTVPPGSVYNPTTETVSICTPGFVCPGGTIASTGLQQNPCPPGTSSPAGSSSPSQCTPTTCDPGYYTTSTSTLPLACIPCGVDYVCPGNPDPTIRTACPLGTDTAGLTTASSNTQCVVSTCNPCGTSASPTTYFTTGSTRQVYVNAALDPTTATNPPTADLLCTMPTDTPEFSDTDSRINDVALSQTNGVASITAVGSADVSATVGASIGVSDITAVPGNANLVYFTSDTSGFSMALDASGNPIAGTEQLLVSGNIGLGAPAAWCNSVSAFAGSSSVNNAYSFVPSGGTFNNAGETTMPVSGLSGAATVPTCA